jgi:hypothetical protein
MLAANALLPNTLQSLSLDWDFPFEYGSTDSAKGNDPAPHSRADIPDFAGLREELIAKCARLTWIFLDGYHFLFWRRKLEWDGTVREVTAYSYGELETRRFSQFDSYLHDRRCGALAGSENRTQIRAIDFDFLIKTNPVDE